MIDTTRWQTQEKSQKRKNMPCMCFYPRFPHLLVPLKATSNAQDNIIFQKTDVCQSSYDLFFITLHSVGFDLEKVWLHNSIYRLNFSSKVSMVEFYNFFSSVWILIHFWISQRTHCVCTCTMSSKRIIMCLFCRILSFWRE